MSGALAEPRTGVQAPAAAGAHVVTEGLGRTYPGDIRALVDVSIELTPGEFALIMGPSGCGKSTLLSLLGGLDRPDTGRVLIDGQDLAEVDSLTVFRRQTVGFVFQLHHLLPTLTAQMNVEVPMIGAGVPRAQRRERARAMLDEVGLARQPEAMPSELSGGERQLVAVARALVNEPRLLLADEPTGSLDEESRARVHLLLSDLRRRHGMTIAMVSHDHPREPVIDRVIQMRLGRIVG